MDGREGDRVKASLQRLPSVEDRPAVESWQVTVARKVAYWTIIQAARDAMIDYRPSVAKRWTGVIHDPETAIEFWRDRLYTGYAEIAGIDVNQLDRMREKVLARQEVA